MPRYQPKPMGWEEVWEQHLEIQEGRNNTILQLSKNFTPIEKIAFVVLHEIVLFFGAHNFYIHWQEPIGKYRADFVMVYKPIHAPEIEKKLVIECDGHDFHERTKEQAAKDKERDRFFAKSGYTVLRYTGSEIVRDRWKIYYDIEEILIPEEMKEDWGYKQSNTGR